MKSLFLLAVFLSSCKANSEDDNSAPYETVNEVIVLTNSNFDEVVSKEEAILVEFYAPWCGHCKSFAPVYEKAAEELKKDGIRVAKVDATVEKEIAQKYEISGYPTLKLFKKGEFVEDFDGMRNFEGVVEYMKVRADPNYAPPPSQVVVLTNSNFDEFVAKKISLVEFYAPWCGHCKSLAPEYEKAANDLKDKDILLGKVDATEEKELAKKYDVTGYPTLFVFRNGRSFQYKGPRDYMGIVRYMNEQSQLPSRVVQSMVEAKNQIPRAEPVVFAYFKEKNDLYQKYIAAANERREEFIFLHTFDEEPAKHYKLSVDSINVILPQIFHSKFEDKMYTLKEQTAKKDVISSWITEKSVPLLGQRTHKNMAQLYTKRPLVVIYYDVDFGFQYIKATQIVREKILPIAHKHSDLTFALCNEDDFQDEMKTVGLGDSGEEINVAIFGEKNVKFSLEPEDEFDVDVLKNFIKKYKQGKLKPYLKSQPIPKRQEGPVRTMVAKNFEEEVQNSKKDYLIEFYAPWCGHCKKLEPVYKKVAKHFAQDNPRVVVAKMDATANDVPSMFSVSGFPTIYFIKAGDMENPILFKENKRTFEVIKDFVEEHATAEEPSKEEL